MNKKELLQILLKEFNFLSENEILSLIDEIEKVAVNKPVSKCWVLQSIRELVKERYGITIYIHL